MAPTTEYRAYHDELIGDPLLDAQDPAAQLARDAAERPESRHWLMVLDTALAATRQALDAVATGSALEQPTQALHPVGFAFASNEQSCGTCAWRYRGGRGRPVERCRQSAGMDGNGRRTAAHFRACERWEAPVDCQACGACCREAYHSVTITMRDPVVWKQPALVVRHGHRFEILRSGDHCAALAESPREVTTPSSPGTPDAEAKTPPRGLFACTIYQERPRPCREFEAGGRHCLVARRRVGLSP
jgi:Fe-S-cluster containining protein